MYRHLILITLIILLALSGCQAGGTAAQVAAEGEAGEVLFEQIATQSSGSDQPTDMVIPGKLPDTIDDPLLMQGWIALYNRRETVELWDGYRLSGQQLAQLVIDNFVAITWNTNPLYKGSWTARGAKSAIYITPDIKNQVDGQLTRLVSTLAHELFHYSLPFGQVPVTLYEEYWAFYAGAHVSGQGQHRFKYNNPLVADSLRSWFVKNNLSIYLRKLEYYPASVNPIRSGAGLSQ